MKLRKADPALLRLSIFVGGLIVVLVLLIVFRKVFQPLLLGLGLAYLLDPSVAWFERRGRSRLLGVIVLIVVLSLLLVGVLVFLIPTLGQQLDRLIEKLPEYNQRIRDQVEPFLDKIEARYPEQISELQERLTATLRDNLPSVASQVGKLSKSVFTNLFDMFLFLLNLIFVPVFAFYLLVDLPKIKKAAVGLIPVPYRDVVIARVSEVDDSVASFLRGQLTIALVLALINGLGLLILDVPFGLGIGIVAGLANMIPYMALVVGLLPALILCWAEHQSWLYLVGVIAVFSGAQLLEGTVLSPRILSRSVNLHPVWVLLAIIAGGSLFGFIGMLIAVPVAAAIQVFVRHWMEVYQASAVYQPSAPAPGEGPPERSS